MSDNDNKGDGSASFWVPATCALVFFFILLLFSYLSYKQAEKQIQTNVNNKFDQLLPQPVFIPKYDSTTQSRIDSIEVKRQILHQRIDNLFDAQLQSALDSAFNQD